jgi:hypothetical protein
VKVEIKGEQKERESRLKGRPKTKDQDGVDELKVVDS